MRTRGWSKCPCTYVLYGWPLSSILQVIATDKEDGPSLKWPNVHGQPCPPLSQLKSIEKTFLQRFKDIVEWVVSPLCKAVPQQPGVNSDSQWAMFEFVQRICLILLNWVFLQYPLSLNSLKSKLFTIFSQIRLFLLKLRDLHLRSEVSDCITRCHLNLQRFWYRNSQMMVKFKHNPSWWQRQFSGQGQTPDRRQRPPATRGQVRARFMGSTGPEWRRQGRWVLPSE